RTPERKLLHVEAVQLVEIEERELEEGPLIALEVDGEGERQRRDGIVPQGVQQLDPGGDVAVRLRPEAAFVAVNLMALVRRRIEREHALHHRPSIVRTSAGHERVSKPCLLNSASAMRSRPNPMHAVCAGFPSAVRMSNAT